MSLAVALSAMPQVQSHVAKVLTAAGGPDDEVEIVKTLLRYAQDKVYRPSETSYDRAVALLSTLYVVGTRASLVAHDDRIVVAAFVDGGWRYADPSSTYRLGLTAPFTSELLSSVPSTPRTVLDSILETERRSQVAMSVALKTRRQLESAKRLGIVTALAVTTFVTVRAVSKKIEKDAKKRRNNKEN